MSLTRRSFIKKSVLSGIGLVMIDSLWGETFLFETNEFYIGNATKALTKLKIIQLSDLHLKSLNNQHKLIAKKINSIKPDLIVITGDTIDNANNIELINDFLKLIELEIKKIAILGNWEYWANVNLKELNRIYNNNNCDLLINSNKQYNINNQTITITGIDDFIGGKADIQLALKNIQSSNYHIILNHCPQYTDTIYEKVPKNISIDFILSGHTHGGQINLLGMVPFVPPGSGKYLKGWYTFNENKMYVSKGIGTRILPFRYSAKPEITIFNL